MQIQVYCESKPHSEDLTNIMLNRPAPNGGTYLIPNIPKEIFSKIKSANACHYLSEDDLEDFDMFYSSPGWRYTAKAIQILLNEKYEVKMYNTIINNVDDILGVIENYELKIRKQKEEEKLREEQEEQIKKTQIEKEEREYEQWKEKMLVGLQRTTVHPFNDDLKEIYKTSTNVGWYTTGDIWYQATTQEGDNYFLCRYGNASIVYAKLELVEKWYAKELNSRLPLSPKSALYYLNSDLKFNDCYGSDFTRYVIKTIGIEELVRIAKSEPVKIEIGTTWSYEDAAKKYEIKLNVVDSKGNIIEEI